MLQAGKQLQSGCQAGLVVPSPEAPFAHASMIY